MEKKNCFLRRKLTRHIDEMCKDIKQTLNAKIKDFQWYLLAVDRQCSAFLQGELIQILILLKNFYL